MELWIRSQDKLTLMKTTYVYVAREEVCAYDENKCWSTIGVYETQERALEVLDEIQNKIAQNIATLSLMQNFTDLKGNEKGVSELFKDLIYEMPKE